MDKSKIERLLERSIEGVNNTFLYLNSLQKKEVIPIKSGLPHLDTIGLGGMFPDTVITVAARASQGKSYTANFIRTNILKDKEEDIGVLLWNLEMPFFTLLMVELKKVLNKSLKSILNTPPTDSELPFYKQVAREFKDKRLTKIDETVTPEEFYMVTKQYILNNIDKKQLFIILDHIGIIKGSNKTESIAMTMEYVNMLKLEFPGKLTFLILGQLNREIESRWRNKDSNPFTLFPDSSSIFGSDSVMFFSDIVMVQVIPQVVGMDKYGVVNRERNEHLKDHICEEDLNSPKEYVRLNGLNRVYYHFVKVRLMDGEPTLYCEILDKEQEEFNTAVQTYEKDYTQPDDNIIF